MPITVAITPLDRMSANFRGDLDTFFLTTFPAWNAEANALQADVNTKQATATAAAATATAAAATATEKADVATIQAGVATSQASAAAASALTAVNSPGTSATSTASIAISTGSKTLTIQPGKAFAVSQFVMIACTTAVSNYMMGQITAHDSATGALTVNVTSIAGAGTYTDWTVSLAAISGAESAFSISNLLTMG